MSGVAATALLLSLACGSTSSTTSAGPSPEKCQVSASNTTPSFNAGGGTGAVTVQAARECGWSASSGAPWIALGVTEGRGDTSLTYTVQVNPAGLPRRASITVSGHSVDVAQEAAPCRFQLDSTSIEAPSAESTSELALQAPAGCAWTASTQADWITVLDAQGTGPGRVRVRIAGNGGSERTTTIAVAGLRVDVRQAAAGQEPPPAPTPPPPTPPPAPPPPAECTFSFSPESAAVGAAGGDGTVQLVTGAECSWTIASDVPWLSLRSAAQGRGETQVVYRVAANADTAARTGRLVSGAGAFVVQQAGQSEPAPPPPPPTCSFDVSPLQQAMAAAGGAGTVQVKAGKECAWTAQSSDAWITITSGSSGTGDGEVGFQAAANTGGARTGTLLVAGRTVTVSQEALVTDDQVTVEGDVADLQGGCPTVSFALGGDTVQVTAATVFKQGSCSKLKDGISVRVRGVRAAGSTTVTATELEFTKLDQIAQ